MINKLSIVHKNYLNYWEFVINDMNFFLEKKNSLGFFNLKHNLYFQFFYKNKNNKFNYLNLFYLFKLK